MDLVFDIVIDFIVTIFMDNTENIIKNKKISKLIRYPVIFITIVLCAFTTIAPIVVGIVLLNKNIIASVIFILIGSIFTLLIIYEIKKIIKEKKM
ncbi:MAG: hypothetical protein J6I85_03575 [Clostridia bacterium]|nr:hypothetical protein [Clostridia bacterium]